jgi:hypothetical protein
MYVHAVVGNVSGIIRKMQNVVTQPNYQVKTKPVCKLHFLFFTGLPNYSPGNADTCEDWGGPQNQKKTLFRRLFFGRKFLNVCFCL